MFLKLFTSALLLLTGTIVDKKYQKYERLLCIYLATFVIFIVVGMITAVYSATASSYRTSTLAIIFCVMFAASLQCVTKLNNTIILRLIHRLRGAMPNFSQPEINSESEAQAEKKFWLLITIYMYSNMWGIASPIFYFFTKPHIHFDDPDLHPTPFFYSCFWEPKTMMEYTIWTALIGFISFTIIFSYWAFTMVMIYTASNIEAHAEQMNNLFMKTLDRNLEKYMDRKLHSGCSLYVMKFDTVRWRDEYHKKMHAELLRYVKDFEKFMRLPFSAVFAWFISTNVLFCYTLFQIKGDTVFMVKSVTLGVHDTVALYLFCRVAQLINELNETLMDSFYCTEWYYLTPKLRKYLLTMLLKCQSKYKNKSFGMYVVNLNLLLRAVRIVYSVLNVLHIIKNK